MVEGKERVVEPTRGKREKEWREERKRWFDQRREGKVIEKQRKREKETESKREK